MGWLGFLRSARTARERECDSKCRIHGVTRTLTSLFFARVRDAHARLAWSTLTITHRSTARTVREASGGAVWLWRWWCLENTVVIVVRERRRSTDVCTTHAYVRTSDAELLEVVRDARHVVHAHVGEKLRRMLCCPHCPPSRACVEQ